MRNGRPPSEDQIQEKRQRKDLYGCTRREVAEKLKVVQREQQRGLPIKVERQTVGQYLDRWLADFVKPSVRPKTHESYAMHVRLYIKPAVGHMQLSQLAPQHVQALMNDMLADGLSTRTVRYMRSILRRSLNQAVKWDLAPRNVATLVSPPRSQRFQV